MRLNLNKIKGWHFIPLVLVLGYWVLAANQKPIGDFGNYYYGSKFLLQGTFGSWVYDPATFNLKIYALGQRNFFLYYNPPPIVGIFYTPFALLPVQLAKFCWNLGNALLLILAIYRLHKEVTAHWLLWWLFTILLFIPLRNNLNEGQSYFLLFYLLVEGYLQFKKNNIWLMAILWAVAIYLKIFPGFVVLFLISTKRLKPILALAEVMILLMLLSLPILKIDIWYHYFTTILPKLLHGEINYTYAINYQSAQVVLKSIFVPDVLQNPNAWIDNPALYHKALLVFKVVIFGAALSLTWAHNSHAVKFSVWQLCAFLLSGHGNSFGVVLLFLPLALLDEEMAKAPSTRWLFIWLLLVAAVPFYWFAGLGYWFQFSRLFAMLSMFGLVYFYFKVKTNWYYLSAIGIALIMPVQSKSYPQNYVLKYDELALMYAINSVNHNLVVSCYNQNGPYQKTIKLPHIQINKAVVAANHNTCLINDSLLIYLSDENRGYGFNTLRFSYLKPTHTK